MTDKKPTSIFDIFAVSESAAEDGKWFDFGPEMAFKIRRFKSAASRKTREELLKPYERVAKSGATLPEETLNEIAEKQIAQAIIVDWRGVYDRDGSELRYTAATALRLIKALPDLRDQIFEIAASMDNFRDEDKEEQKGN